MLPVERIFERMTASGVDQCFLLPHDLSTETGDKITNEDVAELVKMGKGRFYGFASVDPHLDNAAELVEKAFKELNLSGLKLHPCKQKNSILMMKNFILFMKYVENIKNR